MVMHILKTLDVCLNHDVDLLSIIKSEISMVNYCWYALCNDFQSIFRSSIVQSGMQKIKDEM
jgi:hypothetical protein